MRNFNYLGHEEVSWNYDEDSLLLTNFNNKDLELYKRAVRMQNDLTLHHNRSVIVLNISKEATDVNGRVIENYSALYTNKHVCHNKFWKMFNQIKLDMEITKMIQKLLKIQKLNKFGEVNSSRIRQGISKHFDIVKKEFSNINYFFEYNNDK